MQLATLNFRDLGGLPAGDGRKLRHRVLLRGEGPKNLRDPHFRELRELGIRAIFDLRSDGERDADPHGWQDPVAACSTSTLTTICAPPTRSSGIVCATTPIRRRAAS